MATENVDVVRRLLEQSDDAMDLLARGGNLHEHPSMELWHPDCVLEELEDVPGADAYRGRDGVVRYFDELFELWESIRYRPLGYEAVGDAVVVDCELWARSRAGVEATLRLHQTYRVLDGMIVFARGFVERDAALEAATRDPR